MAKDITYSWYSPTHIYCKLCNKQFKGQSGDACPDCGTVRIIGDNIADDFKTVIPRNYKPQEEDETPVAKK